MRAAILAVLSLALASPAIAALAPEYYERAREKAEHVVLFDVVQVKGLGRADGSGKCVVVGKVRSVERGGHYTVGSRIELKVHCMKPGATIPAGPVVWMYEPALKASKAGRAWMTSPGELALYQYEIVEEAAR